MDYKNAFDSPAHAEIFIVILQSLETSGNGRVFFWLGFFGANDLTCFYEADVNRSEETYLKVKLESGYL